MGRRKGTNPKDQVKKYRYQTSISQPVRKPKEIKLKGGLSDTYDPDKKLINLRAVLYPNVKPEDPANQVRNLKGRLGLDNSPLKSILDKMVREYPVTTFMSLVDRTRNCAERLNVPAEEKSIWIAQQLVGHYEKVKP